MTTEWGLPDRAIMTADDIAEPGQVKEPVFDLEGKTCFDCGRYPRGFSGHDWRCRAASRYASPWSVACTKMKVRPPDYEWPEPGPHIDHMKGMNLGNINYITYPPDPPARKREPGLRGHDGGVVYFVDCGEFTKIGTSSRPIRNRLSGLMTDNPFDLMLWGLVKGGTHMERRLHKDLAEYSHRGEWFRLPPDIKARIKETIKEVGGDVYEVEAKA